MGAGWRRFTERARQEFHLDLDPAFQPTGNARCVAMMGEATDFAGQLKKCERDIRGVKAAAEGFFTTTSTVLAAALPRVFEDVNGRAVPAAPPAGSGSPAAAATIGGDFSPDGLDAVAQDATKKLEAEVLAPMQRWLTAFATVAARMKRLEGVRLEVDSRRRTVVGLGAAVDAQRLRLPHTRSKGEWQMEQTIKKMQHKENKLAAARQAFKEQEALVFQQLAQLIRDAVWVKSYLAAVMRLQQEAFGCAAAALGPAKAALAAAGSAEATPAVTAAASAAGVAASEYGTAAVGVTPSEHGHGIGAVHDTASPQASRPAASKVGGYAAAAIGKENGGGGGGGVAAFFGSGKRSSRAAAGAGARASGEGDDSHARRDSRGAYDRYAAESGAVW